MSFKLKYSKEVESARKKLKPVLALESTIIAHGMPFPQNLDFALEAESTCKSQGVTPATVAIIDGTVCVGLEKEELDLISSSKDIKKVSMRELGLATSLGWSGATTVSSTMHIAKRANIEVFATGGIGGVHRDVGQSFDILSRFGCAVKDIDGCSFCRGKVYSRLAKNRRATRDSRSKHGGV